MMKGPYVSPENQHKIAEFDKAIAWWTASLEKETSALQQEAKRAILRKLKHARRKLAEQGEGTSLLVVWENLRDTAVETYDELAGQLAENFNKLFEEGALPDDSENSQTKPTSTDES